MKNKIKNGRKRKISNRRPSPELLEFLCEYNEDLKKYMELKKYIVYH